MSEYRVTQDKVEVPPIIQWYLGHLTHEEIEIGPDISYLAEINDMRGNVAPIVFAFVAEDL
jgi:hypothetical protein